ncbi:MAG TPA: metallophosphoesterase family protein [Vicinamibacterales bacterium]|nr:metallophosphoesterase family protein [Vicinamibacterales bacterium]
MRYLVLSDIHANLQALDAVLADARAVGYDRVVVLGDLVGYGADPNAVVERVRALDPAAIRGNHDKVCSGVEPAHSFNMVARIAAEWTLNALTPDNRRYLAELPVGPRQIDDRFEICHGSPYDEDLYVFDEMEAQQSIRSATQPLCLFGHTHVPVMWSLGPRGLEMAAPRDGDGMVVDLDDAQRYLINPGSVGQPRDGDPRAAYAFVEPEVRRVSLRRVVYPIEAAQAAILNAELPAVLARRLAVGR